MGEPYDGQQARDWQPFVGEEANAVVERKEMPDGAKQKVVRAASAILRRGRNPHGPLGTTTGLVVGYVQSGKTLSFTTVIALARDNAFPLIIVVAGTSKDLFRQTTERLLEDLQVNAFDGPPHWVHLSNPDIGSRQTVQAVLDNWRDDSIPREEKASLLVTVMKHHHRLDNLNTLLREFDLHDVPVVVIDDEADQASLNARAKHDDASTTYRRLLELRDRLPNHTFLQYTATPQAPLLINIIDVLSPEFPEVLVPGEGYVGGIDFFGGNRQLTRVIPDDEVPSADNQLTEPPESLLAALRVFFVGVSASLLKMRWSKKNPNRSMLVHPARTTLEHFQYFQTIQAVKAEWVRILDLPEADQDRRDLVADFLEAHQDLSATVGPDIAEFPSIMARLRRDMAQTQVREVNRRVGNRSRDFDWRQAYAWILVGGQAMDRGFTVKELTVTYMPRGIGTGNADTLQQRARFFGYKRHYLGYCRIYLEAAALGAFEGYVDHEEEMRDELRAIQDNGSALTDWKRRFILSDDLRPCRTSVIQQKIVRGNYADDWFLPHMPKMSRAIVAANRELFSEVGHSYQFNLDTTFGQPAQQHLHCDQALLDTVLQNILLRYRVEDPTDTQNMLGLLLQLSRALKANPGETVSLYKMRPAYLGSRGLKNDRMASIGQLHQGPTRSGAGYSYPGDRDFRDQNRVTIQLHTVNLTENDVLVSESVPILAVWVPQRMDLHWVIQDQSVGGGQ
jgi:hypothetical protein